LAKVVWTAEAEQRLRRIHDYIARDKPYLQRGADEVHILGVFHGAMDLKHYVP
jgi:plasmid stabilization system protein ParE